MSIQEHYNFKKDYFDYSVVISEYPKNYYYTSVKINKSKERILIVTDRITEKGLANSGLVYYFKKNGFVYPLGYVESSEPISFDKNYIYLKDGKVDIKFFVSDRKFKVIKKKTQKYSKNIQYPDFVTIESADKFAGDFASPAGDDIIKETVDGFYFEFHKPQYKRRYINKLMRECINDGVKTQVQMYCCVVKKLHP